MRILSYNYDVTGVITGSTEITSTAQLAGDSSFASRTRVDFYDAGGGLLFYACGSATGVRF